jgi:sterol desaturase/sphingolipid hydroxylase (fatty acid hydroxylase superfamily)
VIFVVIAVKTHSLSTMGTMAGVKRAMTVIFVLLMTVLQIPLIEIIVAPAFFRRENELTTDQQLIQQLTWLFAIVNGILFLGISALLQKLFIIRIPSKTIPWAASNSQLHSMKIVNKVILVVSHLYITMVPGQEKFLFLPIPTLALFAATGFMRIMIIPHYQKAVDWLTRLTELLTASLLLVLIVC